MDNESWFRGTPHYWAEASLPLAYAVACVEVVCKSSEKVRAVYNKIIESWGEAGIKAISEEISAIIPESGKEKIKKAMLNPETELSPDPKPTTHWTNRIIISILIHVSEVGYQFA